MTGHRLELADVFRNCGVEFLRRYGKTLNIDRHKAFRAITVCRTRALGGHVEQCNQCGHRRQAYNSCRNRHCPKCMASMRFKWTEAREAELLPVPYFHVVFTIPDSLAPLSLQNQKLVYGILFRAAWETIRDLGHDPKHLGAKLGMLAVLHTWGQNLMHHPHLHCVVAGGGVSLDGQSWVEAKKSKRNKRFFFPVKVMSRVFRGKFIQHLKSAFYDGRLHCHGRLADLKNAASFESLLNKAVTKDWVVYCKRPFGGPKQVLKYLARYTHRVAIANSRLVGVRHGKVQFRWKDYADDNSKKVMQLDGTEFIRRFLMHVLPSGFVRIRHYGFLGNRNRKASLEKCRRLLGVLPKTAEIGEQSDEPVIPSSNVYEHFSRCAKCNSTSLTLTELTPAIRVNPYSPTRWMHQVMAALWDTT